jgi:hypothetical protein
MTKPTPSVTTGDQTNDCAPPPVNVIVVPAQTVVALALAVTAGNVFTAMDTVAVLLQLFASVPVTVYVSGVEITKPTPSVTTGDQTYEVAPPPVNVNVDPAQTSIALALAVTAGKAFTAMDVVAVLMQLFASVPVTVYVLGDEITKPTPSVTTGDQTYEVAPPPVNVTVDPVQTVVALALAVTAGRAFTTIDVVAVLLQLFASVPVTV